MGFLFFSYMSFLFFLLILLSTCFSVSHSFPQVKKSLNNIKLPHGSLSRMHKNTLWCIVYLNLFSFRLSVNAIVFRLLQSAFNWQRSFLSLFLFVQIWKHLKHEILHCLKNRSANYTANVYSLSKWFYKKSDSLQLI